MSTSWPFLDSRQLYQKVQKTQLSLSDHNLPVSIKPDHSVSPDYLFTDIKNSFDFLVKYVDDEKYSSLQYTEEEREKLVMNGQSPIPIEQVESSEEEEISVVQKVLNPLEEFLKDKNIPLKYVRTLTEQKTKEVKSCRRLKVERYLQKRKRKTWDRKVCYECRQKVAEDRLRIKGKFIKKRKAMELLGIKNAEEIRNIKSLLETCIRGKSEEQVEQILKIIEDKGQF